MSITGMKRKRGEDTTLKQNFLKYIKLINSELSKEKAKKEEGDLNLDNIIDEFILNKYSNYHSLPMKDKGNQLQDHYQKKFQNTGKKEYDIHAFDLSDDLSDNDLVKIITQNTPKANELPKGVVVVDEHNSHASCIFITHDNKIYAQDLSTDDGSIAYSLQNDLEEAGINKEFIRLVNNNTDNEEGFSPQKSSSGCVIFAFKYAKTLLANNCELFNQLKSINIQNSELDMSIVPPDLLKYAQSETVVKEALTSYNNTFRLFNRKKKEIIDYRKEHYGKFRILYHQLKHFSKE
jgi:hypothetical protein